MLGVLCASSLAAAVACTAPAPRGTVAFTGACADVLLVSARGSGDGIDSVEVRALEGGLATELARRDPTVTMQAFELGDADGDGSLDPGGYPAAPAAEAAGIDPAAVPSEGDLAVAGGYDDSRRIGSEELARHLGEREPNCPDERIVVAGYSMGAAAVGVGLRALDPNVLERVDAVELFGDPTVIVGPWMRAPGVESVRGLLGARNPYVPEAVLHRTTSWCGRGDPYCTGNPLLFLAGRVFPCELPGVNDLCEHDHDHYPMWAIPTGMAEAAAAVAVF